MTAPNILSRQQGSAATEFALWLPLMLLLLFGGFEAGHFIWTQHKLTEAVRNGVRFASRLQIDKVCPPDGTVADADTLAQIKLMTRTGQLANAGARPLVPGWTTDEVVVTCGAFVNTGIYTELGNGRKAPVVTIKARNVAYIALFHQSGVNVPLSIDPILMGAEASGPVTGI